VGIDRSKMRLYDVEQSAQQNLSDSGQEEIEKVNENLSKKFASLKV